MDGAVLSQCLPEDGVCECSPKSVALGLATPCVHESEYGVCVGVRICTEAGLSDCDAAAPEAEVCDGDDDDCDGEVDEGTCDDGNQCTEDACLGQEGCEYVALNGVECLDGDLCTTGDHCEAGVCVGVGVACDDGDPCTDDACDPETGECVFSFNVAPCDDGDPCTVADLCQEGVCVGVPVDCDCQTDEDCGKLEDGDLCNGTLYCNLETFPHQCEVILDTVIECPEPEGADAPCLAPACDPETGECGFAEDNEGFPCADDDLCTIADSCEKGECVGGVAANCNDGNPCTDDLCEPSAGCQNLSNSLPCDDGDVCTIGDLCADGECEHGPAMDCDDGNVCTDDICDPATGCVHVPNNAACDDLNACTDDGQCAGGICIPGKAVDCDDGSVCTDDSCEPLGGCQYAFNTAPCTDGNPCTEDDTCTQGLCLGQLADCDDGNLCTDDGCSPDAGCVHTPNAAPCNDGNACTLNDACEEGACQPGEPINCNDANPCTDDACEPAGGCQNVPNTAPCDDDNGCTTGDVCTEGVCAGPDEVNCDDGNVCTDDLCYASEGCVYTSNAAACDDGNACTDGDACAQGLCVGLDNINCDDGNPCTTDSCAPATGCVSTPNVLPCDDGDACTVGDVCAGAACAGVTISCDDGNVCTDDLCLPASGCQHLPNTGPCDDLNTCTTGDICVGGVCVGVGSLDCDDGNPCTKDFCLPGGGCAYEDAVGACDDGDPCTVNDACVDGVCVAGTPMSCGDGNPCTDDACEDGACVYAANTASCDDGNACTTGDHCADGICAYTGLTDCDDGNPCTADWCSPLDGCLHTNTTLPCNDGNACTTGETCMSGVCQGGNPLTCNDGNLCTDDACDPQFGCVFTPNSLTCDDGNACTTGDICSGGTCQGSGALDCNDGELCTTDICLPATGCQHLNNTSPCDDGDLCTVGDVCGGGTCLSGSVLVCDDSNPCTSDACLPATGCVYEWTTGACEDGNVCTTGDACVNGTCQPGDAIQCVDGNPCTDDSCDPILGCQYFPNAAPCSDGDLCTDGDTCAGGTCAPGDPLDCDDGDACTADSCDPGVGCAHDQVVPEIIGNCEDLLGLCPSLPSGNYEMDLDGAGPLPTMEFYCDMVTDGGGWTGFTTVQAHQFLGGDMECPDAASVMGIDGLGRPYTLDGAESHTCHYTFDVPFGYTEFHLLNYKARANAGAGNTSELATADFWKMVSWNQAPLPNGYYGDIGFGTAAQSGPVATYSEVLPSIIMCKTCEIPWPAAGATWSLGLEATTFRIGWGEDGPQHEGWYPWWEGLIAVR